MIGGVNDESDITKRVKSINTLGNIRQMNEIMAGKTVEEFVDQVASSASTDTPPNFEDIVAINRGGKDVTFEQQQELEIGPNRCAVHYAH